jgi:hypothetical protein
MRHNTERPHILLCLSSYSRTSRASLEWKARSSASMFCCSWGPGPHHLQARTTDPVTQHTISELELGSGRILRSETPCGTTNKAILRKRRCQHEAGQESRCRRPTRSKRRIISKYFRSWKRPSSQPPLVTITHQGNNYRSADKASHT